MEGLDRYQSGWDDPRKSERFERVNRQVDDAKAILLSKPRQSGFGLVFPKPEGGLPKAVWQFYKAHFRLFHETHWADPKNWKD